MVGKADGRQTFLQIEGEVSTTLFADIGWAQCRADIIAPESSEHLSDYCIRNVWSCDACGYQFEIRSTYRTSRQTHHRAAETNKIIGDQLRAYYRACMTEELPPRLLALLKKLDEETEPSAEQVEVIRDIES
jgi:hypothetical protein